MPLIRFPILQEDPESHDSQSYLTQEAKEIWDAGQEALTRGVLRRGFHLQLGHCRP